MDGGPRRKAEWVSLTLLPSALPRRSARGTARPVSRAQRFRSAVARPSEGRDTAFETGRDRDGRRTSSQSGVGVADAPTPRTPTALRAGNRRDLSPAPGAFGVRWQGLRKAATPLSRPGPTAGLVGPRRKAEWASLTLLPSALRRRSARGTAEACLPREAPWSAVTRPSEGRGTALKPGATAADDGPCRKTGWASPTLLPPALRRRFARPG